MIITVSIDLVNWHQKLKIAVFDSPYSKGLKSDDIIVFKDVSLLT